MSEKLEYADFLESGAYVKKLEETYNRYLDIRDKKLVEFMEENKRLHSIIKEVREILKFHLSNPSGTKNGWHIDIWNSEDISKLNEDLGILDKEGK